MRLSCRMRPIGEGAMRPEASTCATVAPSLCSAAPARRLFCPKEELLENKMERSTLYTKDRAGLLPRPAAKTAAGRHGGGASGQWPREPRPHIQQSREIQ